MVDEDCYYPHWQNPDLVRNPQPMPAWMIHDSKHARRRANHNHGMDLPGRPTASLSRRINGERRTPVFVSEPYAKHYKTRPTYVEQRKF